MDYMDNNAYHGLDGTLCTMLLALCSVREY